MNFAELFTYMNTAEDPASSADCAKQLEFARRELRAEISNEIDDIAEGWDTTDANDDPFGFINGHQVAVWATISPEGIIGHVARMDHTTREVRTVLWTGWMGDSDAHLERVEKLAAWAVGN
jgi:hypothetical protein